MEREKFSGFMDMFRKKKKAKKEREIRERKEMTPEQKSKLSERDRLFYDAVRKRKKKLKENPYMGITN